MSKRRVMSDNPARRVIRINPPSQTASSSARVITTGRGYAGDCTRTLSSSALATTMNLPSRKGAIAGNGVLASRDQLVRQARAFSPKSLAHRRISDAPILSVPSRCLICSAIGRDALEMQQRHEGFESRIDSKHAVGFSAHHAFSRAAMRYACCGIASTGG